MLLIEMARPKRKRNGAGNGARRRNGGTPHNGGTAPHRTLREIVEGIEVDVRNLKTAVGALGTRMAGLESRMDDHQARLEALEAKP